MYTQGELLYSMFTFILMVFIMFLFRFLFCSFQYLLIIVSVSWDLLLCCYLFPSVPVNFSRGGSIKEHLISLISNNDKDESPLIVITWDSKVLLSYMWSKWDIKITRWRGGTLLKNWFLGDNSGPNTSFSPAHINFKPLMVVHKQGTRTWATLLRFTSVPATARPTVACFRWNIDPSVETSILRGSSSTYCGA